MYIRFLLPPLLVAGMGTCLAEKIETTVVEAKEVVVAPSTPVKETYKKEHTKKEKKEKVVEQVNTEELLEEMYKNKSGFGISQEESQEITDKGGAPTYGEILYESLKVVLDQLNIGSQDVFYDLGSGIGKVALQAYLDYPFKKVVGIELSETRVEIAKEQKDVLKEKGSLDKKRKLEFIKGDITHANLKDATVVYMCSTCYSPECMNTMVEKLSHLKPGLIVITLKALPAYQKNHFTLVTQEKLHMTWTKENAADVYVYKLEKKDTESKADKKKDGKEKKKHKKELVCKPE